MDKTKIALLAICIALAITVPIILTSRIVFLFPRHYTVIEKNVYRVGASSGVGQLGFGPEIHCTITQYRWIDGAKHLIYSYSHPAALTTIGENFTAAKQTGHTDWNVTGYLYNVTYIALGHNVGLTTSSTVLPGEWNRTDGTFEYIGVGHWNYSASFYPSGSGTTNSTSMNWEDGIGQDNNMWCYDTFTTITYTSNDQIDVEWEVDIQYS